MIKRPETRYAKTESGYVGYQVIGEGPPDLLLITNWFTTIELWWEQPMAMRFLEALASLGRLVCFDKRGTGVSDALPPGAPLEQFLDDMLAVMDAVGSQQAVVIGTEEAGAISMLFAASYPERTSSLVLINTFARFLRDHDYPEGLPTRFVPDVLDFFENNFGTRTRNLLQYMAPVLASDERFAEWFARAQRLTVAPMLSTSGYRQFLFETDVRPVLPTIRVPTLVLHREGCLFTRVGHGRYLGASIPGARYVELPGDEQIFYAGDAEDMIKEIRAFVTGAREAPELDRVLATVLFTDIVTSTERASELGDRRWRSLLDQHDAIVRTQIERFRGKEVKSLGDGFLATFDGPGRAIHCAAAITDEVRSIGIDIRAGLHTGEVELRGEDVGGIAVHIAARVLTEAGTGEVVVSSTVKDLVVGSGLEFVDRGNHSLKGVPGEWRLYAVKG
jgi:class 3 adenylate cyclase